MDLIGDCHDVSNGSLVITLKVSGSNIVLQSIFTNLEEILFGSSMLESSRGTSPLYVRV